MKKSPAARGRTKPFGEANPDPCGEHFHDPKWKGEAVSTQDMILPLQ
jgi:hypothetical protein